MSYASRRIQAVIFDLDDTLIDWSGVTLSWQEVSRPKADNLHNHLCALGHPVPEGTAFAELLHSKTRLVWEEAKKTYAGASFVAALRLALEDLCINPTAEMLDELLRVYDWGPVPGVSPFADTHSVLETLKSKGYKIGLITNAYQPMWMRDVELLAYDLMKYLDARITSGDTGFMKPHPAIYWRMLGMLDLMPHQAVFVGDRPSHDIVGAHNVGMTAVLMSPPHLQRDLAEARPDYTITTLSELLPILEELG